MTIEVEQTDSMSKWPLKFEKDDGIVFLKFQDALLVIVKDHRHNALLDLVHNWSSLGNILTH